VTKKELCLRPYRLFLFHYDGNVDLLVVMEAIARLKED